jgi:hypothetical protein
MNSRKTLPAALWLMATLAAAAPADKKLAIVRMALAQSEDGALVGSGSAFVPGETVFFSCQVEGYTKSPADKDDNRDIRLTYRVEARDTRGVLLQAAATGKIEAAVGSEDKDWKPKIRETIVIPPLADTGQYQVLVTVQDALGPTTAEARTTLTVHGREVAPSETLVVRNFRFQRSEDDAKPLLVAAFRPGDAVWARFDMTGYKLGDANQLDIEYGLVVLRADGTVAYSEPHAADQKEQPFYPQRYQPGVLSLNLAKDQQLGQYTIVLTVRDNLGKQNAETREKFSVE